MDTKTVTMGKMNHLVKVLNAIRDILSVIIQNVFQIIGNVTARYSLFNKLLFFNFFTKG